jgi:hypothetical protein
LCCDPNLGLATKARACKGAGWKGSPWVIFHFLGSVWRVWGNEPTHSQMGSHFGN